LIVHKKIKPAAFFC